LNKEELEKMYDIKIEECEMGYKVFNKDNILLFVSPYIEFIERNLKFI